MHEFSSFCSHIEWYLILNGTLLNGTYQNIIKLTDLLYEGGWIICYFLNI